MKPIGQTFFVNEPTDGAAGVYIKQIDIYFAKVSPTYGVTLQLRETENGVPTSSTLAFGSKTLFPYAASPPGDVVTTSDITQAPVASADASIPTSFIFDTPVFAQSGKSYAFAIIPVGGNPDYQVWTASIGGTDVSTNVPIYRNNSSGDLFLSSNDITWDPVITEDIKYTIYIANFTSLSGTAKFITPDEDWFKLKNATSSFTVRELLVFSNGYNNTASLSVSSIAGSFNIGDTVWQNNGSVNSTALVYFSNSSMINVNTVAGSFSSSYKLFNSNSSSNATVVSVRQTVASSNNSNTVTVPDSTIYSANDLIFIQTNDRAVTQTVLVSGKPSLTSISLYEKMTFTDAASIIGPIAYNGKLTGSYSGPPTIDSTTVHAAILDSANVTFAQNLVRLNSQSGIQVIGTSSGTSAVYANTYDAVYNSITPNFNVFTPSGTTMNWYVKGIKNDGSYTKESSWNSIEDNVPNEFTDFERLHVSRSQELMSNTGASVNLRIDMATANSKISPAIDTIQKLATYTYNLVVPDNILSGYTITTQDMNKTPAVNAILSQSSYGNTSTGTVYFANSTFIRLINTNGKLLDATAFTATGAVSGNTTTARKYNETSSYGLSNISRYMSKPVLLADGQDSEDIQVYIGAYRPSGANFRVYAKIHHTSDPEPFGNKDWSRLTETSSPSLVSSKTNQDDLVELVYNFPNSSLIFNYSNTISISSGSNTISMPTTAGLTNNSFIYLQSNTGYFNVREIVYVVNSTAVVVDGNPSFTSSNALIGTIPIESKEGAFKYDQNLYTVRYVRNDVVYDTYIQFAIKIVPTATTTAVVPRASDLRVIALQL
jgi:hypothetical protein